MVGLEGVALGHAGESEGALPSGTAVCPDVQRHRTMTRCRGKERKEGREGGKEGEREGRKEGPKMPKGRVEEKNVDMLSPPNNSIK